VFCMYRSLFKRVLYICVRCGFVGMSVCVRERVCVLYVQVSFQKSPIHMCEMWICGHECVCVKESVCVLYVHVSFQKSPIHMCEMWICGHEYVCVCERVCVFCMYRSLFKRVPYICVRYGFVGMSMCV